ncbi:MAG: histidine phosphatase family protein [Mesorhizobium sp.]|uniref:histidine phosphatase family protein n=1 Tax=Mesorhizobium sp. TaxID=1871066 RepID=UPI0011FE3AEB|nr:histidine phosphatase family protein [Mesorhizobium sp.]TIL97246.1 MAG: histidine phosphatase family protein [Mesorhizobium sp.]
MGARAIRFLVGLAAGLLVLPHPVGAQDVIYIVRHSDPPSTLNLDEILDETPLSESGQQRAKMLAERLKDAGVTTIYATQAKRTVETAEPLAKARGLETRVHSYEDSDGLVRLLRSENGRDRVLVVGHWSTIPEILKALGYPDEVKIERSAYDNLFVVVPKEEQAPIVLHLHY